MSDSNDKSVLGKAPAQSADAERAATISALADFLKKKEGGASAESSKEPSSQGKAPASDSVAALADFLKKKEDGASAESPKEPSSQGKAPASDSVAALADFLKKKEGGASAESPKEPSSQGKAPASDSVAALADFLQKKEQQKKDDASAAQEKKETSKRAASVAALADVLHQAEKKKTEAAAQEKKDSVAALADVLQQIEEKKKEESTAADQSKKAPVSAADPSASSASKKPAAKAAPAKAAEEKAAAPAPKAEEKPAAKKPVAEKKAEGKAAITEQKAKGTAVKGVVKNVDWPAKDLSTLSHSAISSHERDFYTICRRENEISDLSVLHTYLSFKKAYDPGINGWDTILDYKTGEKVGDIPHIKLSAAWEIAQRYVGANRDAEDDARFGITLAEWNAACEKIEAYIQKSDIEVLGVDKKDGILLQHLFKMSTLEYQLLSISRADRVFAVVEAAILCDIEEATRAARQWKKIKYYKHKVALEKESGGIFSAEDASKIREGMGIECLNDICMYDVYSIKALLLEHAFGDLVKEINAAFREDQRKRSDRALAKYPYIFGNLFLIALTALAYKYKYTIIKAPQMHPVFNAGVALFGVVVLTILCACVRVKARQRHNPEYVYRTQRVKRRIRTMSLFAVFVLCSIICFYQRYDGYNDTYYYRDVADNQIAIAGLVHENQANLGIPEAIDEKTVVKIDLYAFDKTSIKTVAIPTTVESIEASAFKNCEYLTKVSYKSMEVPSACTIEKKAFAGCNALFDCEPMSAATVIKSGAFKDCYAMEDLDLSSAVEIGEGTFENCTDIASVTLGENLKSLPDQLFKDCTDLTAVYGFEHVENLGKETFSGCDSLRSVDFTNIKTIGKRCFYRCESLTKIYISNTIEEVGKDAFSECNSVSDLQVSFFGKNEKDSKRSSLAYYFNCSEHYVDLTVTITGMPSISSKNFKRCPTITNIVLADEVATIEPRAFAGMNIESITLSPAITEISERAFADCNSLAAVYGTDSVISVGKSAFENCTSLASVYLPAVTSIGWRAFMYCDSLAVAEISGALSALGESAFEECNSLASLNFSSAVFKTIEENTFKNAYNLKEIVLPASLEKISNGAFYGCSNLEDFSCEGNIVEIGEIAFRYSGIRSIDLSSVKKIGEAAFKECENLENVTVSTTVESLGRHAFADCDSLVTFESPFEIGKRKHDVSSLLGNSNVETLIVTKLSEANANFLSGAGNLGSVVFKCDLTKIKTKAFEGMENLYSITLPDTIKTIGAAAFKDCTSLSTIVLPTAITEIASETFSGCTSLEKINIPAGVETIGRHAFYECKSLKEMLVPASVSLISSYAFSGCIVMNDLRFEGRVKEIEEGAFAECEDLETVVLPDGLVSLGKDAFKDCYSLSEIKIPDTVTSIGADVLSGCSSLRYLTIPFIASTSTFLGKTSTSEKQLSYITDTKSLVMIEITSAEKIAANAFKGQHSLEVLVFGKSVEKIGDGAVDGCYSLERIVLPTEKVYKKYADVFEGYDVYESLDAGESYEEKAERLGNK